MWEEIQWYPINFMPVFITTIIMTKNRHNNWHNRGYEMAVNLNKDAVYRAAKPDIKDRMINDSGGLYLLVKVSGAKWWHFIYTFLGKQKKFSLGVFTRKSH